MTYQPEIHGADFKHPHDPAAPQPWSAVNRSGQTMKQLWYLPSDKTSVL